MPLERGTGFDQLVDHLDLAEPRNLVVIAVFYHQIIDEPNHVAPVTVQDTIDETTDTDVDTGHVLQELRREDFIQREADDRYILTKAGFEYCLGRMEDTTGERRVKMIDFDSDREIFREFIADHRHYMNIIEEINRCYRIGTYTGTALLCRALFEQLSHQILHDIHEPKGNPDMFYNTDINSHLRFSELLENMKDSHGEINRHHSDLTNKDALIEHINTIQEVKVYGDKSAHSTRPDVNRDDLEPIADLLSETFTVLYSVLLEVNRSQAGGSVS